MLPLPINIPLLAATPVPDGIVVILCILQSFNVDSGALHVRVCDCPLAARITILSLEFCVHVAADVSPPFNVMNLRVQRVKQTAVDHVDVGVVKAAEHAIRAFHQPLFFRHG